jgi:hypothetical protein
MFGRNTGRQDKVLSPEFLYIATMMQSQAVYGQQNDKLALSNIPNQICTFWRSD